jgi:hypothetical protein
MADRPSPAPPTDVFDKLLRLHALIAAEAALANDKAARESGVSLFSESERGFLQRVESGEDSAPPSEETFDQLFRLFGRVAEAPYVPFPGRPRLKQMEELIEAASHKATDGAHPSSQTPVRHRTPPSSGDDRVPASAGDRPEEEAAEHGRLPYRRRSRPILGTSQTADAD